MACTVVAGTAGTDTVDRADQVPALLPTMVAVTATIIRIMTPGRVSRVQAN